MTVRDHAHYQRIGRIGGLTAAATTDTVSRAMKAQEGLRRKFYEQTDPSLPEPERERRAKLLWLAHLARLGHASKGKAKPRQAKGVTP